MTAACLFDLSRTRSWVSWAQTAVRWKVASSLGLRLVPLAILISLPQIIQVTTGRTFSLRATVLAMLDITVPLATVGSVLGASALLRARRLSIRARGSP